MKRVLYAAAVALAFSFTSAIARDSHHDYLWAQGGSTTVTPGTPFTVNYYTAGDQRPIRLRIYRIGVDRAIALTRASNARDDENGELVWEGVAKSAHEYWTREVSVGPFPIGLYAIHATLGTASATMLANVTTLGVLTLQGSRSLAVWAIDLRTFRRHQGPTTIRLAGKQLDPVRRSDLDGVSLFSGDVAAGTAVIAQSADGSVDVSAPYWNTYQKPNLAVYAQVDRPVYRPGQTVNFRAIVREGDEEAYRIPAGRHRIEVTDSRGTHVYSRRAELSPYGTLSGSMDVPQSAPLGSYQISIDGQYARSFYVEAYKKPEYVLDVHARDDRIVSGDDASVSVGAQYVFGRPAAGMQVHYNVWSSWSWYDYYDPFAYHASSSEPEPALPSTSGDAVTDAQGNVRVPIPTAHVDRPYSIAVSVTARDRSGRTVSTQSSIAVYPAAVRLDLAPSLWFANPGQDVALGVTASQLHGKPAAGQRVDLRFTRETWDERERKYQIRDSATSTITTDAAGTAVAHWRPSEPGSYEVVAQTHDARGYAASASRYVWVMGGDESWMPPAEQPMLVAAHETLTRGERPRVLVRLPAPGRDVLLAVTSDRIQSLRVMHVTGYAASLGFDAPPNATVFTVQAFLPSENGVAQAQVQFHRASPPKRLHVIVRADRKRYEPEQRAILEALVTDANGRPVRTELSLGVVDDAIYAVQQETAPDPLQTLYGASTYLYPETDWYRPNYIPPPMGSEQGVPQGQVRALKTIAKVSSRAASLVRPGTTADTYGVNGLPGALLIRKNFVDTAYWTPSVVTDARGRARISFAWPDNLTTWRTTALGVTADTDVGTARTESLVTKDFLVRLEMPRFLRKGDTSTIVGIAQGQRDARDVRLSFLPDVKDPLDANLRLDENESATATWPLDAGSVLGNRTLTLVGSDGVRRDAMQLPLPVESAGAAEHVRDAGVAAPEGSLAIALPAGYDAGTLHLTLTPSVAAQLLQNVRMLDVYPYYCTEQTMSAALPAVFVDRMFDRFGLEMPSDVSPPQVIRHAIDRLSELQHADGSWGWWENDDGHPFMTAYAVYGLAEFKKAGFTVPDALLSRGIDSLVRQLQSNNGDTLRMWGGAQRGSEWNTRAFMLFSLADADPSRLDRDLLTQTLHHADRLNSYALAVLGLTYHELGDDASAKTLLERLNARAVSRGPYTYWTGDTWHYAWEDDPIETTAYALRLNAALEPDSQVAARAVAFLRSEQHGSWWYTTKDTAAAVYAIAQAEHPSRDEFQPDETVAVYAGDTLVKTVHITSPVLNAAEAEVDVAPSLLRDGTPIRFVRSGHGALYWSSDFTRYAPWSVHDVRDSSRSIFARLFPAQPPLRIQRSYRTDRDGAWAVGDVVHVDVTVTARDDVQYVAIEDPFPAGVEYAPPQGEAGSGNWSGVQFFDDRAVFFADRLYRDWPLHLSYDLRVTSDGRYSAPPPIAYAMYGPPVSAAGDGERVVVQR